MRSILVTGGCGFIGANFIHLALQSLSDCRIINLDNLTYAGNPCNLKQIADDPRYRFVQGDICDIDLVQRLFVEEMIDTVVHFAAESHVDRSIDGPTSFIRTNIVGTFTLLEAARSVWVTNPRSSIFNHRFLHVSTDEVYGSLGETGLFAETTSYNPRSPYSASKASSDHLISAYHNTYGLPVIITHCTNNYGPYQFPEKLIPLIINNALLGKDLPVYGDGKNIRDWLYVGDNCQAILTALQKGQVGRTYNIGGNSEKQNIEVVRLICDLLDEMAGSLVSGKSRQELIRFVTDRPGHDRRYAIDGSRIRDELGWEPAVTFEEGIRKTVQWYLENRQWSELILDGSYQPYYEKMYVGC